MAVLSEKYHLLLQALDLPLPLPVLLQQRLQLGLGDPHELGGVCVGVLGRHLAMVLLATSLRVLRPDLYPRLLGEGLVALLFLVLEEPVGLQVAVALLEGLHLRVFPSGVGGVVALLFFEEEVVILFFGGVAGLELDGVFGPGGVGGGLLEVGEPVFVEGVEVGVALFPDHGFEGEFGGVDLGEVLGEFDVDGGGVGPGVAGEPLGERLFAGGGLFCALSSLSII